MTVGSEYVVLVTTGISWGLLTWGISGGIVSFFSPCTLPMLPAYMGYYLSTEQPPSRADGGTMLQSVPTTALRRGTLFGTVAGAGVLVVFVVVTATTVVLGNILTPIIPWLQPVVGVVLVVLGGALLTTMSDQLSLSISLPEWNEPTPRNFFSFGILFALAALACTAPVFIGIMLTALSTGGTSSIATVFVGYAGSMIVLFMGITAATALARDEVTRRLQTLTPYIERASAVLLLGAGVYILYYWYSTF